MKNPDMPGKPSSGRRFSLQEAAAISAVEGIVMTKDIERAFAEMDKARLNDSDRRAFLASRFGKGSSHGR